MENQLGSSSSALRRRGRIKKKIDPYLSKESFLPDDIIIDILSWLPAKDVLRSRCVCKRWMILTSTRDFTDLHLKRSFPMILKGHNGLALLDRCWETRSKIQKLDYLYHYQSSPDSNLQSSDIYFSHNGLIVGQVKHSILHVVSIVVYNPIYLDVVKIRVPEGGSVCGVFFHPVQKEYCILWQITVSYVKVQYKILNLESKPHWRNIGKPFTKNDRIWDICPILLDKGLYWMVEASEKYKCSDSTFNCDIIEYDIRNENFWVIPCPVPVTAKWDWYNVNLLDIDGVVSLVEVFPSKELVKINIWTLKDHGEVLWTSSQYIIRTDICPGFAKPKAVAVRNDELILQSNAKLYVCNLKLGTCRKSGQQYGHYVRFLSHVTSLVSLRNWKSKIRMVEEDDL